MRSFSTRLCHSRMMTGLHAPYFIASSSCNLAHSVSSNHISKAIYDFRRLILNTIWPIISIYFEMVHLLHCLVNRHRSNWFCCSTLFCWCLATKCTAEIIKRGVIIPNSKLLRNFVVRRHRVSHCKLKRRLVIVALIVIQSARNLTNTLSSRCAL